MKLCTHIIKGTCITLLFAFLEQGYETGFPEFYTPQVMRVPDFVMPPFFICKCTGKEKVYFLQ